jgi:protein tyrosine phosphatase (PTP) superfamily phosphohydrolase (DUF442 family)
MTNIKKSKQLRSLLIILLVIAVPLGYYLYFFSIRSNFREVVPQKVYRSAQPRPAQLKKWVRDYGIRTVINLRGYARKTTDDEQAAADESGVRLITIRFKSTSLPTRKSLNELIQTLETADQPILIHCRSGVDRTGSASTLAAMAIGKENYETAKWQAYVPMGPWKRNRRNGYVHISDMFKLYERHRLSHEPADDDWQDFKQWASASDAFGDTDTNHRIDYTYLPESQKAEWLHPLAVLFRGAWAQFAAMLILSSVPAVIIYKKLLKN